jgi:very-short-patch-repair endonuclease
MTTIKILDNFFSSHEKVKYWSNKNNLKPNEVTIKSKRIILFNCDCGHDFYQKPYNIYIGYWCPFCSIPQKQLCANDDCKICYEKSFASHEKAKYWSIKNELTPRQVFGGTLKKYIFNCNCGHEIIKSLHNIRDGTWCPYCGTKIVCDNNDCEQCFNNSFASHEKAQFWSKNNKFSPRQILLNAHTKILLNCNKCKKEFESYTYNVVKGSDCPYCKNKTELILFKKLNKKYPTLLHQFKTDFCKNKTYLPYDFVIPNYNIIIELDGRQHFTQVSKWLSPEKQQINDIIKMKYANDNNYYVIRLLQEDVLYDKYNWYEELNENINKIINDKSSNIYNIYMCKNNEYNSYNN